MQVVSSGVTVYCTDIADTHEIMASSFDESIDEITVWSEVRNTELQRGWMGDLEYVTDSTKNFERKQNELNNLHNNLRPCVHQQNDFNRGLYSTNTSGITGVAWHKVTQKWIARIMYNRQNIHLGLFPDKEDAIRARLRAEDKYFGEFAPQRNLFEQYGITPQNECEETE